MKRAILTFGICFITLLSTAQNWAPIGAKWTYGVLNISNGYRSFREWICVNDTVIGTDTCKIIERNGTATFHDVTNRLIIFEDSNRIYWYNTIINQFSVLYDFNKNQGDTWNMKVDSCDLLVTVDSTGSTIINGNTLKILYIHTIVDAFSGTVVQGIGNLNRPYPDVFNFCYNQFPDGTNYDGLRCYDDNLLGFHDFNIAASCDDITSVNEDNSSHTFTIYPNPSSDLLNIETTFLKKESITIGLYNVMGVKVMNIEQEIVVGTYKEQINIKSLPAGVYFLSFQTDNTTAIKKVVKQ